MSDHIAESHRHNIGCSQLGQLFGLSKFGTRHELWEIHTGRRTPEDIGNELRVALGEPMEDVLRPFVAARLGRELRRDKREYRHPTLKWVAHPDYRASRSRGQYSRPVVDMKTSLGWGARHRFGDDGTDDVDDSVLLQMQGSMKLLGTNLAYVAALVPGPELKIFTIEADRELHEMIEDGVADFWRLVETDTPPDPQSEVEARQRWSRHVDGKVIDLDDDALDMLQQYAALKEREKAITDEIKAIRDRLIPAIADADSVAYGGVTMATFRANKDSIKIDWKSAFEDATRDVSPDLVSRCIEQYTRTSPGARVLRLTKEVASS